MLLPARRTYTFLPDRPLATLATTYSGRESVEMPGRRTEDQLHLPDLSISGFRGIASLQISRLGRVTLLTGRNGVGKTTVLEAVRVFASRGGHAELSSVLMNRGEHSLVTDDDGDRIAVPDLSALFFGRRISGDGISIGSGRRDDIVNIREIAPTAEQMSLFARIMPRKTGGNGPERVLASIHGKNQQVLPLFLSQQGSASRRRYAWNPYAVRGIPRAAFGDIDPDSEIDCVALGPGLLTNYQIARFWDTIALTDEENKAVQALRVVLRSSVERVAIVAEDDHFRRHGRSARVRLRGEKHPVPLKSLGDGAVRLLSVALGLANSAGGFLVMDEAENGIHYSAQRRFWRMVLETAHENDVQVLATTHSWDCVRGFAEAVSDLDSIKGAVLRIERKGEEAWAVEYSEDQLRVAAEQRIEVR